MVIARILIYALLISLFSLKEGSDLIKVILNVLINFIVNTIYSNVNVLIVKIIFRT